MIRVIKHGNKHYLGKCPVCYCEFEYTFVDTKRENYYSYSLACPECGKMQSSSTLWGLRERFEYDDEQEDFPW